MIYGNLCLQGLGFRASSLLYRVSIIGPMKGDTGSLDKNSYMVY